MFDALNLQLLKSETCDPVQSKTSRLNFHVFFCVASSHIYLLRIMYTLRRSKHTRVRANFFSFQGIPRGNRTRFKAPPPPRRIIVFTDTFYLSSDICVFIRTNEKDVYDITKRDATISLRNGGKKPTTSKTYRIRRAALPRYKQRCEVDHFHWTFFLSLKFSSFDFHSSF